MTGEIYMDRHGNETAHIDAARIPEGVMIEIARPLMGTVAAFFTDPAHVTAFDEWKKQRYKKTV